MINLIYLNENISLKYGINSLIFENPATFRDIYYNTLENIKILDGVNECTASKLIIIKDLLNLSINDKKNLTYLFKLSNIVLKEKYESEYLNIIMNLKELLSNLTDSIDLNIEFDEVDTSKLFQAFNLKYSDENLNYIENVLSYISIINAINSPKLFITFNLMNYITEEEYKLLEKELLIKQIIILDISLNLIKNFSDNIFNVDDNYCII